MYLNKCLSTTTVVHAALIKTKSIDRSGFARDLDFHIRLQSRYRLLLSIDTKWLSTYAHAYA